MNDLQVYALGKVELMGGTGGQFVGMNPKIGDLLGVLASE